jgi:hypothetical protein
MLEGTVGVFCEDGDLGEDVGFSARTICRGGFELQG